MQEKVNILKALMLLCFFFVSVNVNAQIMKKTLYLIPGQGSDCRIFKNFKFQEFDTIHIKYIIPDENDSMISYAKKLSQQIDTSKTFSIIGVSLGGMLAVEMSEFLIPEEVIIISSAKNRNELPLRYKFMKKVPLNNLFGGSFLQTLAPTAQIIVEPDSYKERELCVSMLKNKNELFMKRSVNMIINWKRTFNNTEIIHIHGNNDHTIPIRNVKNITEIIENGSHMMTLTRGKEVCKIIKTFIR